MANTFLFTLKQTLDHCISELDQLHSLFCLHPETDFTRERKITFQQTIRFMIEFQSKTLPNEVMDYFGHSILAPTKAAFIQQRDKVLVEGWDYLFHSFTRECRNLKNVTYKGYRLLACDGSDSNIYRNSSEEETFIHEGENGYNMIPINALSDLMNHTYADFIVQGKKKLHERKALNTMVDRYSEDTPTIFIADRGYESFNTFAHMIENNVKFIVRTKDIDRNGILSSYDLPNAEFDDYIRTTLTRRIPSGRNQKALQDEGQEETSFRELKYTIGLNHWHSRKYNEIIKELHARMILYNYCEMAVGHAVVVTCPNTKHSYKINFATAVNICRAYLKDGSDEHEIMLLIQRHLTPIIPDRTYPLKLHPKRNRDFVYRTA